MNATLQREEQSKYVRAWAHRQYREWSPGEIYSAEVAGWAKADCKSVLDVGCGTGRAAPNFRMAGLDFFGCDIARNCLDTWTVVRWLTGCNCRELPFRDQSFDLVFSCDVLEHLPEEWVAGSLREMSRVAAKRLALIIATEPDLFHVELGTGPLHLTVKPPEWWEKTIAENVDRRLALKVLFHK